MARQTSAYVYGSSARAYRAEPLRRDEERVRRIQQERQRQQQRAQTKRKPRVDRVSVFLTCLTFAGVMAVGITYIYLQFQSTYLSKSVVNLQSEVVEMEKENAAAEQKLALTPKLSKIYKKATKELGMKRAKQSQIFTYDSQKSTQIHQYGKIPSKGGK